MQGEEIGMSRKNQSQLVNAGSRKQFNKSSELWVAENN